MIPMSNEYPTTGHLPITDVDIDGRAVQGDVVYPYTLVRQPTIWRPTPQQANRLAHTHGEQHHLAELEARADPNDYFTQETPQLIGQCVTANTVDDFNAIVRAFLSGDGPNSEPLALPNP